VLQHLYVRGTILMAIFHNLLRLMAVIFACVFGTATVAAAEIRMDSSFGTTKGIVLEGKIEAGDFDKFKNFILNGNNAVELYLASPGGNLGEAIKIGLLVRMLKLSTVVPSKTLTNQSRNMVVERHNLKDPTKDYMCASACFFIFVAGIHRSSDNFGPVILGIHRPSISDSDLKRLSRDQATAADDQARTTVERYLAVMGVPARYAENMYSVPYGKIRWIRNDEFETDFNGFVPELKDWVKTRCGDHRDLNASMDDTLKKENGTEADCERNIQNELALRAYGDVLKEKNINTPRSMLEGISPPSPR
jgi:hypothetical protein